MDGVGEDRRRRFLAEHEDAQLGLGAMVGIIA